MKTYNIYDILQVIRTYSGTKTMPKSLIQEEHNIYLLDKENRTNENQDNLDSIFDEDINSMLDIEDEEFVMNNIQRGKVAEKYVKSKMIEQYGNCEKVEAKYGYDFKIIVNDNEIKLEVKSIQNYNSPFHITINEINHAIEYKDDYFICFAILPSLGEDVKDIKFLRNPIEKLGIILPEKEIEGLNKQCRIIPEKFLVKPIKGLVKSLTGNFFD